MSPPLSKAAASLSFFAILSTFLAPAAARSLRARDFDPAQPSAMIEQSATDGDLKWQPGMDFDTDSCYNVPAIDGEGNVSPGLESQYTDLTDGCRDESDLSNQNAYVRTRCNNGWCVHLYGYYFEKDVAVAEVANGGHRHDWEHVAVWVQDDQAKFVAASAHGGYDVKSADEVRFEDTHPLIVYHKDGAVTHAFRFANDEEPENHYGTWIRSPLISWGHYPEGVQDTLVNYDFGKATMDIKDARFTDAIGDARPGDITFDNGADE